MSRYRDLAMTPLRAWATLALTVVCEVAATLCVKASSGLTELVPSLGAFTGFALTTLLLAKVVEVIPTSIAYTVWTGTGAVAVTLLGAALFGDRVDPLVWLGIALVVLGVATVNLPRRQGSEVPPEHVG